MPGQVMLATESTTARLVLTSVWLETIGVVSLDVRLEVERTSKSWKPSYEY